MRKRKDLLFLVNVIVISSFIISLKKECAEGGKVQTLFTQHIRNQKVSCPSPTFLQAHTALPRNSIKVSWPTKARKHVRYAWVTKWRTSCSFLKLPFWELQVYEVCESLTEQGINYGATKFQNTIFHTSLATQQHKSNWFKLFPQYICDQQFYPHKASDQQQLDPPQSICDQYTFTGYSPSKEGQLWGSFSVVTNSFPCKIDICSSNQLSVRGTHRKHTLCGPCPNHNIRLSLSLWCCNSVLVCSLQ